MAKKINVNNILAGLDEVKAVTETLSVTPTHENVPTRYIHPNPNNEAAKNDTPEDIADLAAGIQTNGLIHPLAVNQLSDTEYRIISGERRFKAITTHLRWDAIPCTVYHNISPAAETVTLLIANLQAREYTVAQKLSFYRELDAALHQMKESGEYKGGISKGVAQLLGVSDRQVRKYKRITENLTENQVKNVTNINEAAAAASEKLQITLSDEKNNSKTPSAPAGTSDLDKNLKALDAIIDTPRIGYALQNQLDRDATWEFYITQLPTTKEAIAFLKPKYGYDGNMGWNYPDGESGEITRRSARINIEYGQRQMAVKYGQADSIIREMIKSGKWLQQSDKYYKISKTLSELK